MAFMPTDFTPNDLQYTQLVFGEMALAPKDFDLFDVTPINLRYTS